MRKAEETIVAVKAAYLQRTAELWKGHERELLIEMVRGLDEAAFAFTMAPNRAQLIRDDHVRQLMLDGAASALHPLLLHLAEDPGGVPWGPSLTLRAALADEHLMICGKIAGVLRIAQLERFGLAEATFVADDRLVIEVPSEAEEYAERQAGHRLARSTQALLQGSARQLASRKADIAALIDQCVYPAKGWFIGYDNSAELVAYHRDAARIYSAGVVESEALPAAAMLGGRSFSGWTEASVCAYGAVLQHCAFATRLKATNPSLNIRDLLTVYARKEDIRSVWEARGETFDTAPQLISALTLDGTIAARCDRDHDLPLPYYIDFGRDFVLLPMFGGLLNPFAGGLSNIRSGYRRDWDKAVNGREAIFRDELRALLPTSRYLVPPSGTVLKRSDGSRITDVDAMVVDRSSGELVLVQLKWPDIYGRSLAERNSRRLNLLGANEWVDKVSSWIAGRSADEVSQHLGLGRAGPRPPVLLVLTRHVAHFTGETGFDERARWLSWPSLATAYKASPRAGIVFALRRRKAPVREPGVSFHELPGLTVEIRSG